MYKQIFGIPKDEQYEYEYVVVFPRTDGNFDFYKNYETIEAYNEARRVGAAVIHNPKIHHKKLLKNKCA